MKFKFEGVEFSGDLGGEDIVNLVSYFKEKQLPHFLLSASHVRILTAKYDNTDSNGKWMVSGELDVGFKSDVVDFIAREQGLSFNSATDLPTLGGDILLDYARFYWLSGSLVKVV